MVPRIAAIHPKILGESCVLCYTLHSKECSAPVPCPLGSRRLMRKFIREALLPMCGAMVFQKICTKEELLPLFGRTYFDFETLRRKGGRRPPFTKVSLLDREIFGQHHSGRNWMLRDFRMPNRSWGMRRGRPLCPGPLR